MSSMLGGGCFTRDEINLFFFQNVCLFVVYKFIHIICMLNIFW